MSHPILLALDLGITTGWAISSRTGRIMSGIAEFKHRKFEGGGMCFLRFEAWINEIHNVSGGFKAIYFKDAKIQNLKNASHSQLQFVQSLLKWCELNHIPYEGVPSQIMKYFVTQRNNPNENEMMQAVKELGHIPDDKNEMNALALIHYAREQHQIWEVL